MSTPAIAIAGRLIGPEHPPYIIAEMSANHNGDLQRAFRILAAAKAAGADAIKLQTYTADTITLDSDRPEFRIQTGGLWDGQTLHQLYAQAHLPWEWHAPLFARARELGLTIFSTPFDFTAVDLLESLGAPAYKIASFELVDLPLVRRVAQTGKPLIMSTGLANEAEIAEAVQCARDNGARDLVVLHCVSGYPAPAADYHLRTVPDLARRFGVISGLSDHTLDNATAVASVALGACVIEKHFTLDRRGGGPDDSFSLEPAELAALCRDARTAWSALGRVHYDLKGCEAASLIFRRSLYVVQPVRAGEPFTPDNVRSIRPGCGLPPKTYDGLLGRKAARDIAGGTPLSWDLVAS
ncbi:MAG: pseudaminic acid synthase [Opitutaceae bacterium]|nr:pseudaminic acid synthase [Opitutaceae bacterium]